MEESNVKYRSAQTSNTEALLNNLRIDAETYRHKTTEISPYPTGSSLDKLITNLERKIDSNDQSISKIRYPRMLIDSLKSMNRMIGMSRLKESVALQVMRLINALNEGEKKMGMLNTVLYGEPGVGKTQVGIILAKIWYSLGFLEGVSDSEGWTKKITETPIEETSIILMGIIYGGAYLYGIAHKVYETVGLKFLIFIIIVIAALAIWFWMKNKHKVEAHYKSNEKSEEFDRNIISVVSREDFVASYVGQTAPKTKRLLEQNLGKVLLIDEAYQLLNEGGDPYGPEALTTLNLFLSENENRIVVIFAGYKDKLENGIFKAQPGLPRRCMWHFECDGYDGEQLGNIFLLQLKEQGWNVTDEGEVLEIIKNNSNLFPSFGGDTKRLTFFSQLAASKNNFYRSSSGNTLDNNIDRVLSPKDVADGIEFLKDNNIHKGRSEKKIDYTGLSPDLERYLQRMSQRSD